MNRETGTESGGIGTAGPPDDDDHWPGGPWPDESGPDESWPQRQPAIPPRAVVAGLAADPRLPVWIRRGVISAIVFLPVYFWHGWRLALSAAALAAIVDTLYQAKTMALIPAAARVSSAQRRTSRRLLLARPFGYLAVHTRTIPGTASVLDHLVIGPGGVYAVDSQRWDRRLPVRTLASGKGTTTGQVMYHGPFSQKDRLNHAGWEAAQASRLLSQALGRDVPVKPVMVIYGPTVPWAVASLRGVDVLAGRSIGKYFRSRKRARKSGPLSWEEAGEIFAAAQQVLPYL